MEAKYAYEVREVVFCPEKAIKSIIVFNFSKNPIIVVNHNTSYIEDSKRGKDEGNNCLGQWLIKCKKETV